MERRSSFRRPAGVLLLAGVLLARGARGEGGADQPTAAGSGGPPSGTPSQTLVLEFAQSAARVFRGRCVAAEPVVVALPGGGGVAATRYEFTVDESLKGLAGAVRTSFVQVGRADGGANDLGRLVGLPTYQPGIDYVLFLLPESKRGLTSPAGAGEGALRVVGEDVLWLPAGHGATARSLVLGAAGGSRDAARDLRRPLDYGTLRALVRGVS